MYGFNNFLCFFFFYFQAYHNCEIIRDLLTALKKIVEKYNIESSISYDSALGHLLTLICYLIFSDKTSLREFFKGCISLHLFEIIKKCLTIRTKEDQFSVVQHVLALFLKLYVKVPPSRHLILEAFEDCISGNTFNQILRYFF